MAGLPDASGGIGYANVFGENRAIDDWRDDWKYKQALKTKKAEQQAKLKLDIPFLDGWASKDSPELNQLYNGLANRGAALLAAGTDPMTNPQFLGQTQKAKLLAAAGKEHEATFNQGVTELDALLKTGDITPDQYREAKGNWMDYANAGITDEDMAKGKVGRIAARMQMTPPSNPMPFNADDYANKQITVLDAAGKVKTPTLNPDGTISTDERVPQATIQKQLDYNNEYLKAQGVPQDRIDVANNKIKNAFGYTKTRTVPKKEDSFDFDYGTGRIGKWKASYSKYVPKATSEQGATVDLPETDAIEITGKIPESLISNVRTFNVQEPVMEMDDKKGEYVEQVDEKGKVVTEQKSIAGKKIDKFTLLRFYKAQDGGFIAEGNGTYENADGVKKSADMNFRIDDKYNKNLIEENYFGGEPLEKVMAAMKKRAGVKEEPGIMQKSAGQKNITQSEYESLKSGDVYYFGGKKYTKK